MKRMDHVEYPKKLRAMKESQIRFIITDCKAALAALPDNPNAGYYLDEINYCSDELARRRIH